MGSSSSSEPCDNGTAHRVLAHGFPLSAAKHSSQADRLESTITPRGALTLGNVILPLQAGPLSLGHLGRLLWLLLFVEPALVEHLGQVGRVHLSQLLIVIQSCCQVPVLACKTAKEPSAHLCLGSSYPHHPPGATHPACGIPTQQHCGRSAKASYHWVKATIQCSLTRKPKIYDMVSQEMIKARTSLAQIPMKWLQKSAI